MCLAGDVSIPVADGRSYPVSELVGRDDLVTFACTPTGRIKFGSIRVIRGEAIRAHRIILDDNASLTLATDSACMLRNGAYRSASLLEPGTSLMPLYTRQDRDGYTLVQQNYSGRFQKAHWIVARSGLLGAIPRFEGQRTVIHHRNFEASDNRPANL